MAFDYTREEKDMPLLIEEVNELVSILVNHFQGFFMEDYQYKTSQENMSPDDLHRLSRITRYIMLNYNKKITLDDVSEMEHLSSYYASHLIKKTLGFNFQNFVNAIRLEFAEKLLVFSSAGSHRLITLINVSPHGMEKRPLSIEKTMYLASVHLRIALLRKKRSRSYHPI